MSKKISPIVKHVWESSYAWCAECFRPVGINTTAYHLGHHILLKSSMPRPTEIRSIDVWICDRTSQQKVLWSNLSIIKIWRIHFRSKLELFLVQWLQEMVWMSVPGVLELHQDHERCFCEDKEPFSDKQVQKQFW